MTKRSYDNRHSIAGDGLPIEAFSALAGALALAFMLRMRSSAAVARLSH